MVYQQARLDKATLQLAQSHTDNIEGYVKHRTTYAKVRVRGCVCVCVCWLCQALSWHPVCVCVCARSRPLGLPVPLLPWVACRVLTMCQSLPATPLLVVQGQLLLLLLLLCLCCHRPWRSW